MLYKFPMAIVKTPKIAYFRLTGMISNYAHHRVFVVRDEDKHIIIWTTVIVKGNPGSGMSWCYCSHLKQANNKAVNDTYNTWMRHNIPPKFPAEMYDNDLSIMGVEEVLRFFLNFEFFDIVDQRGEGNDQKEES